MTSKKASPKSKPIKKRVDGRHEARKIALQALFEWSFHSCNLLEVARRIKKDMLPPVCDDDLLEFLLQGVKKEVLELDKIISRCAPEWPIPQLPKLDLNILRIAIYELYLASSVPPKVAVDEAVELAKEFSGSSSASFVNGALGTAIKIKNSQTAGQTALFVGQFQPLHRGHLQAIREIAQRFDHLIIVIGSSDSVKSFASPLSSQERRTILEEVLMSMSFKSDERVVTQDENQSREGPEIDIIELADEDDHDKWFKALTKKVPPFSVVYTNNALVESIFTQKDIPVFPVKLKQPKELNSKSIIRKIALGGDWKRLVPAKVERYLKERQIVQRIAGLMEAKA